MRIEIPDLGLDATFNSYYIGISAQLLNFDGVSKRGLIHIRTKIEFMMELLKERLDSLSSTLYFPVILYDQGSYALRFRPATPGSIEIAFVSTMIEGYSIDLSRPETFRPEEDHCITTNGPIIVQKADLRQAIDTAIDHMKNIPYKEPSMIARNYPGVSFLYPKPGEEE